MAIGLTGLARAFRHFVLAAPGTAEGRVAAAMRAHPEYVAGTRRSDTWLMREVPGTLSKMGAEAVQAVALADGRALAFKIEDGGSRALGPVLARALPPAGCRGRGGGPDRAGAAAGRRRGGRGGAGDVLRAGLRATFRGPGEAGSRARRAFGQAGVRERGTGAGRRAGVRGRVKTRMRQARRSV